MILWIELSGGQLSVATRPSSWIFGAGWKFAFFVFDLKSFYMHVRCFKKLWPISIGRRDMHREYVKWSDHGFRANHLHVEFKLVHCHTHFTSAKVYRSAERRRCHCHFLAVNGGGGRCSVCLCVYVYMCVERLYAGKINNARYYYLCLSYQKIAMAFNPFAAIRHFQLCVIRNCFDMHRCIYVVVGLLIVCLAVFVRWFAVFVMNAKHNRHFSNFVKIICNNSIGFEGISNRVGNQNQWNVCLLHMRPAAPTYLSID